MNCTNHPDRHGAFALEGKHYCTECHTEILKAWNPEDSKKAFDPWEADCHSLYEALGVKATVETVDFTADIALQRIAVLKYLAIEYAANGDCSCDKTKASTDCDYCIACHVAKQLGDWTPHDQHAFDDFKSTEPVA